MNASQDRKSKTEPSRSSRSESRSSDRTDRQRLTCQTSPPDTPASDPPREFQIGDTVRLEAPGKVEAEITGRHPKHAALVECSWFDRMQNLRQCYFNVKTLK